MLALLRDDDCVCLRCVCVVCARYVCVRRVRTDLAVRLAVPQLLVVRPSSVKHIVRAQRCASPFSRFSRAVHVFQCVYVPAIVFVRVHTHTHTRERATHKSPSDRPRLEREARVRRPRQTHSNHTVTVAEHWSRKWTLTHKKTYITIQKTPETTTTKNN